MKKKLLIAFLPAFAGAFSLFAQTTVTFSYTGSMQTFTVPANITTITVDMAGASGGEIGNLSQAPQYVLAGMGGRVQCDLPVTPNSTLNIFVGGRGQGDSLTLSCFVAQGGFNGGGIGYGGYNSYNYNSGGGGGATDIRIGGTALTDRKLVAGGGGGSGCSGCTGGGAIGGDGGSTTGDNGQSISCFPTCNYGSGGTQSAGGAAGFWACQSTGGTPGALGTGGDGSLNGPVTCGSGGGGGGGYYGGGGGSAGPGGGGSSYTDLSATNVVHTKGYQHGNGYVTITYGGPTSVSEAQKNYDALVHIFPNPTDGQFNVNVDLSDFKGEISVVNMVGEVVKNLSAGSMKNTLDLSGVPAGIYFVKVQLPGTAVVKKLIKN